MSKKMQGFVQRMKQRLKIKTTPLCPDNEQEDAPQVIPRQQHSISRSNLSKNAVKVMYRLKEANFQAFLVGGGVRDCLLNRKPKDFDVATDATPEEIRQVFRNSRIIGRRFRLAHVYFRDEVIEVSTFRSNSVEPDQDEEEGAPPSMVTRDNIYGTIEEDAWRRDFTVNALYYNIADFSVVDYTGGMQDLAKRQIRMIGDPTQRFHEDPVRLLRAIRLAAKLEFSIESETETTLSKLGHLLKHVPLARLLDEVTKLFFEGYAKVTYDLLEKRDYIKVIFPGIYSIAEADSAVKNLIQNALNATDDRYHNQQRLTPAFLLGVIYWPLLQQQLQAHLNQGGRFAIALHKAMHETLLQENVLCLITRRMSDMMQSMWTLQFHLEKRRPKRLYHVLNHRYFRAAYDLLHLRASVGLVTEELANWWHKFQLAKPKERRDMAQELDR